MTERATARQHSAVRSDGPAPSLRSPSRAAGVFDLHATAGNAAVTAMLGLLPRLDERAQSRAVGVVPPLRARMERALGTSVGDVAVHTDPEAGALADRAGARALTVGRHVLVAPGRYAPSTAEGEALLAHEVVHAVAHRSGATGVPSDEHEVDRAGAFAVAGIRTPVPRASSPIGRKGKNEPVVAAVPLRRLTYPDGRVAELPEPAYQAERAKAVANLRRGQRRVLDHASVDRDTHKRYLDENHVESFSEAWDRPSRLWGVAANIRAGVVPPTLGIWDSPNRLARDAAAALDRDDLHLAAGLTQRAQQALTASERQWHDFLGTSIAGGEKLQGELETTRDVSFAIAIAAAAVIAAPVVATGVAATGATGLAATGLTALGTGAVTGAGGFVLRSGSEVAGQASTGKVDVKKAAKTAAKHLPSDVATGLSAGLAPGAGQAAGLGKTGLTTGSTIARHAVVQGGVAAVSGTAEAGIDTARAVVVEDKTLGAAAKENLVPGLKRAGVNVVGAVATAPLGPAGQALGKRGLPVLGGALSHAGGAAVAGGTTLALGGTREEATSAAIQAGVVSTALAGAHQPTPVRPTTPEGPAGRPAAQVEPAVKPVAREEAPVARPAGEVEPAVKPVAREEAPVARPAGEVEPAVQPVAREEAPVARPAGEVQPAVQPVAREEAPVAAPASEVQPAVKPLPQEELPPAGPVNDGERPPPSPAKPVTRQQLGEGTAANENLLRPVEAGELPVGSIANLDADVAVMTGSGTSFTSAEPHVAGTRTVSSGGVRPPSSPTVASAPPTTGPGRTTGTGRAPAAARPGPRPAPPLPARRPAAPAAEPTTETRAEFEARRGVVKRLPPGPEPEGQVTAQPKQSPLATEEFGEGPLVEAMHESSPAAAGVPAQKTTVRKYQRPRLPRGDDAPRAEIGIIDEPLADPAMLQQQEQVLADARTSPRDAMAAGTRYGKLMATDFPGGPEVTEAFGYQGRRLDMGTEHEFTIEGRNGPFGSEKLDQLWNDLAQKNNVTLSVPRLHPKAADQLARMLAQARELLPGPTKIIVVRQTQPR